MGKVVKEKKHRGVHRAAGPFDRAERDEAANAVSKHDKVSNVIVEVPTANGTLAALSRGQRKRLAKKVAASRKQELLGSAEKKMLRLSEGTFGDMKNLSFNLPAQTKKKEPDPGASMKMTKKNRKRVLNAEVANFQAVLAHPAFQANPMSTIQCHLENSIRKANSVRK